jgi:hypothetical protein
MKFILNYVILPALLIMATPCVLPQIFAEAADLGPDTLKAWNLFVDIQEKRIAEEIASQKGFLALDFQNPQARDQERRLIFSGNISIQPMTSQASESGEIRIPGGIIHHWRGSVLVPGTNLDYVLSRVQHPELETSRQEDVLDSRVLERSPDQMKLFLKLQRSKIVTAVYNTEHIIRFFQHGTGRASSRSIATKIAELNQINGNTEQEKPEGHDRGFLWKMNSYWRYQQAAGGVIIECESITLSRSIPSLLDAIIRPIIRNIAQDSMQRTLQFMRLRLDQANKLHSSSNKNADLRGRTLMDAEAWCRARQRSSAAKDLILYWDYLLFEFRSKAALVVTGSIRENPTSAPIATAISSVAIMA